MEKDEYWSVDKLLPRVRVSSFQTAANQGAKLSLLSEGANQRENRFGEIHYPTCSRVICHYALHSGRESFVFPSLPAAGETKFVPCDLYMPTYLTLSPDQRSYFIYFLEQIKENKKPQASFAYIKLAVCFILAEAGKDPIPDLFFDLWDLYRTDFPAAEKLFCDVYSDWCFLRKTKPDYEKLSPFLCRGTSPVHPFLYQTYLFDYLFADEKPLTKDEAEFILRNTTSLSFRKSRAYKLNKQYAAMCEEALQKAVKAGIYNKKETNACLFDLQIPAQLRSIRPLFSDLPREYAPQVEICLVYVPLLGNDVIRDRLDAVVRYVDNRIRSILHLKNRLSQVAVTPVHKSFLDEVLKPFEAFEPIKNVAAPVREEKPDPPRALVFDPQKAGEIEENSWAITQKLTEIYQDKGDWISIGETVDEDFDRRYDVDIKKAIGDNQPSQIESKENPFLEFAASLSDQEDLFMSVILYQGADEARLYVRSIGQFFDAFVASLNEKAVETTGDAVLDAAGSVYDDYTSELKEVFPPREGV